jgi:hypothetical protein
MKMNELTESDLIKNDLLMSGFTAEEVAKLTRHLDEISGPVTAEWMRCDFELEAAQSLGSGWLIHRIRALAECDSPIVAIAAMELLVNISIQTGVLLKPELIFNKLR